MFMYDVDLSHFVISMWILDKFLRVLNYLILFKFIEYACQRHDK